MKEYIKNIIAESLKDEVDVDREWERLFSSIEKKTISKMKTRRLFLQYMKYAAAVLLGIGISLSTLYLTNQENLSTVGNYKLVTSKGEKSYLQLPDGTRVWLNSCTTLEYAENYGHSNRSIYLDGEAYFEVSKNPKKPFRVKANGVTIRVLGTHFNVNAYAADSLVETTLLEGSVSVSNNANGKQMILKPNETAIYRKSTGILSMHINANAQNEISWREGVLSFNDISMGEIARQLSHHFNVTIQIKSEQLRNYKLNARFKQNETLEEILEMLAPIVGFTYHMPQSNLIELKQEN